MMVKRKAVITYLDEEYYNILLRLAQKKGASVSQIVREILLEKLGDSDGQS
ncbi:ribbon-helix-helix protein, CopG family [Saccharolobus caldissimus]|uniref:Ribbon-helix-helix protein CopG domain-containing protein n=1 Tax=Saccharolobus caldissimus TaxID=1702097 RepID=A0AAQ4CWU1_9CREN|nr:ribbon-helix-helix protein, CopG family [Saccharolobus caldissimus]BDC00273.1 hypothetical protein SACC_32890 [Saccharolobus caldissimus]